MQNQAEVDEKNTPPAKRVTVPSREKQHHLSDLSIQSESLEILSHGAEDEVSGFRTL